MGLSALELGSAAPLKHLRLASRDLGTSRGFSISGESNHLGSFRGWCDQAPDVQRIQLNQGVAGAALDNRKEGILGSEVRTSFTYSPSRYIGVY